LTPLASPAGYRMKLSVIGTGMVGRALAGQLAQLGHDVVVGTRNVQETLARTHPDAKGTPSYTQWQQANQGVRLATFADAGAHGDVVVNATAGAVSLICLEAVGAENLNGGAD
jgi:predicted dinucleotide-binding enzyme